MFQNFMIIFQFFVKILKKKKMRMFVFISATLTLIGVKLGSRMFLHITIINIPFYLDWCRDIHIAYFKDFSC